MVSSNNDLGIGRFAPGLTWHAPLLGVDTEGLVLEQSQAQWRPDRDGNVPPNHCRLLQLHDARPSVSGIELFCFLPPASPSATADPIDSATRLWRPGARTSKSLVAALGPPV